MINYQLKRVFVKDSELFENFLIVTLETDNGFFEIDSGISEKKEIKYDDYCVYEKFKEWYNNKQLPLIEGVKVDYEGSIIIKLSDGNFLCIYLDATSIVNGNSIQVINLFTEEIIDSSFLENYDESENLRFE